MRIKKLVSCLVAVLMFMMLNSFTLKKDEPEPEVVEEKETCINRLYFDHSGEDKVVCSDGTKNYALLKNEAEWVSRVLYGTARKNTESERKLAIWCILNRVESKWYPNSVMEVCRQRQQFMGYDDENPIIEELYDLAYKTLAEYYFNGVKPMSCDYVYMTATDYKIELRDSFEITSGTRYWTVNDIK